MAADQGLAGAAADRRGSDPAFFTRDDFAARHAGGQRLSGGPQPTSSSNHAESSLCSIAPASPAPASPSPPADPTAKLRSLDELPRSFLQLVLAAAGAGAGGCALASRAMLAAWRGVVESPALAARWLRSRFGASYALNALASLPAERYLQCGATPAEVASTTAAALRVHIMGLLVEGGCAPHLHPPAATALMHDACVAGSETALRAVLRCCGAASPDPHAAHRALLAAVERNHAGCARELLRSARADPCRDESLALRLACKAAATACVTLLLDAQELAAAGAGPHSVSGLTLALAQAAVCGHAEAQAAILRAARNPRALASLALVSVASTDKATPGAVHALVAAGADAGAFGNKALKAACRLPCPVLPVIRELLSHGADARVDQSEPLVSACRAAAALPHEASAALVAALLAAGAGAGAQEGAALRLACKHGAAGAVGALLAAPPGTHTLFGVATAVAEAAVAEQAGVADACLAACAGLRLDGQAVKDLALIQCCQVGSLPAVRYLLGSGARTSACGTKSLALAAEAGHAPVVEALLRAGADAQAGEGAAVAAAARRGHTACVQLLLAAGADPCARDSWALWVASEAGHLDTVGLLLAAGADPTIEDAGLQLCDLQECQEMDWDAS